MTVHHHYTQGQAIEFIERCFGTGTPTNGGLNLSVICPKCAEKQDNLQKKKLVIRTDDFLSHCWVCNYRATNLLELLSTYHPNLVEEYRDKFKLKQSFVRCPTLDLNKLFEEVKGEGSKLPNKVEFPRGFTLLANHLDSGIRSVNDAWRYLKGRGVTASELWLWKFGVTDYKPMQKGEPNYRFRVIVPSFDPDGNLNYFSARAYWDKLSAAKYSNPHIKRESVIFNEINIDWSQELTLVEGVFDLIKCNENATCLLGSTLDQSYLLFQRVVERNTPVVLALDHDAQTKTYKLAKLFAEYGIRVRLFPLPPGVDVGLMTKREFMKLLPDARVFSSADFLRYKLGEL